MYAKSLKRTKKLLNSTKSTFSNVAHEVKEVASSLTAKVISYSSSSSLFNYNAKFVKISEDRKLLAAEVLKPGDIVLVKTPTFLHSKLRMASNTTYDHCVVILDASMNVLQVSFPKAKLCKVWPFVNELREPLIIRPKVSDE